MSRFKAILSRFGFGEVSVESPVVEKAKRQLSEKEKEFHSDLEKILNEVGGYFQVDGVRDEITGDLVIYGVYAPENKLPEMKEFFESRGYSYENEDNPGDAGYPSKGKFNTNIYPNGEILFRVAYTE